MKNGMFNVGDIIIMNHHGDITGKVTSVERDRFTIEPFDKVKFYGVRFNCGETDIIRFNIRLLEQEQYEEWDFQ